MKLDELDKQVTQADIDELEKFADKVFGKVGIDVNFTRHFLDRVNDERNGKPITMSELTRLFKQEQKRWGKKIAQLGPDEEGVMKDLQTDINLPFALRWDSKNDELDLIAKTVMRKSNFRTPNPEFPVESKLPAHLAKHFDKDGDALKGSWKDGEWKADKKQPKKIKTTVKDVTPKGYGPTEDIDPVDMAAAAGVSGAVGSMIGNRVGKAVDRDLRGDGPEDRRRIKNIKQDRQKKLTKTPSVRGNANSATKPTSAPMTAKLPGVTRGGAGAGGASINPKRVGGGGRLEPKLRSTPFNMFNESGEFDNKLFEDWYNNIYKPARDRFPEIGQTIKKYGGNPFSGKSIRNLIKKHPNIVNQLDGYAKKYGKHIDTPDFMLRPIAHGAAKASGYDLKNDDLEFAIDLKNKFRSQYPKAWNQIKQGSVSGALNSMGIQTEQINEEFGSVPPLAELILMAVVAKTSVDVLLGMFKVALKTGKGLKKLNDLRKRVAKMGQGVADYAMPHESVNEGALTVRKSELHDIVVSMVKDMDFNDTPKLAKIARLLGKEVFYKDGKITVQSKEFDFNEQTTFEATKDELLAKLQDQYRKGHMAHAVHAMRALAQSKGDRHGLSYYAATIARAFSAIDRKELEAAYREKFSEGIIHEDTLTELNILKKKKVGVTQSNPLIVLDKISARNDNKPFPIKFYDGETIEVTPQMARRFMNKYYDDLEPEQRDIVDRYIKTKNGFMQAVQKLQISEGWSDKYKKSIDCNNPKGFSQKAHCAGRKKK